MSDIRDEQDNRYDFRATEAKWQERWESSELFTVRDDDSRPPYYGLDMFPYPSGAGISVGHCRNYVPLDVACRFKVMQGYNVLHPMGWDAFGQPAENEAIKRGRNPKEMVPEYAANYKRQLKLVGISYDWSREVNSSTPEYYRWTQWMFLLLHKRGLAYRANTPINWCPSCKTGLANEEVVNGRCWRCNSLVEKRPMPQWFFKITAYADRLISGLEDIQWPEGIKALQSNWIGRSEGAEVDFKVAGTDDTLTVFTTRPDTLWGATFMVVAPEHPLVDAIASEAQRAEVQQYRERAQRSTEMERQSADRTKTGVFTGGYAINPVNDELIPIWVADYVLMGYGTGAIMAVPAHDQRDFEFARKYHISIVLVYQTSDDQTADALNEALPAGGAMALGPFTGAPNDKSTVGKVIAWLEERGQGKGLINYRIRDWLISRQRYWGAPIPIIHCPEHGAVPVPEADLPVVLPDVDKYQPTGTGESPLAGIPEFVNTICPVCGAAAKRETDTMGGFACSSWYFLRFADPHNTEAPFSSEAVNRWLPVDLYVGGAEHAVMHLLYARFWTKVLHDAGYLNFDEPFQRLRNQGMLLAWTAGRKVVADETEGDDEEAASDEPLEDWKVLKPEEKLTVPEDERIYRWVKMSKSLYNVITPDEMAEKYGADSLRLYGLFVAPFEDTVQWSDKGIEGASKFVNRVWRLWNELRTYFVPDWRTVVSQDGLVLPDSDRALRRKLHQTIRKVGDDLENFRFNTCIAALMELTNEVSLYRNAIGTSTPELGSLAVLSELVELLPLIIAPITPHMSDEMWERLGKSGFTFRESFPSYDDATAAEESVTIVVQVNGKVRDRIVVSPGTTQEEVERLALACEKVARELEGGKTLRKVIPVPGKLINLVIS